MSCFIGRPLPLAPGADHGAALDLHEWTDTRLVTDSAAIEIRERLHDHALAEVDVLDQAMWGVVRGLVSHLRSNPRCLRQPSQAVPLSCPGRSEATDTPSQALRRQGTSPLYNRGVRTRVQGEWVGGSGAQSRFRAQPDTGLAVQAPQ